ncbi:hypothetical protein GCM10022197_16860 [Microlunatus spumicola]|uniref:Uncharacterized protein n=1 Tax=Microlunatus spumicola TaxID=81499 RepID=A0ABP6X9U9_9ACTN
MSGPARGARTATVVVTVLVLALVAVLVGLVGDGGSGAAAPATSTASAQPRTTARPTAPARRASPAPTRRSATTAPGGGLRSVSPADLPREAQATLSLIDAGGPFPYAQDGATFGNYERVLPAHPRGWYREYTVRTPGERDRGPRRIVTGDDDRLVYYTGDHYATFVQVVR